MPIVVGIATDCFAVADDHDITVEQGLHHARNSDVRFELDRISSCIPVGLEDSIAEAAYRVAVSVVGGLSYLIQCHRFYLKFFLCLTIRQMPLFLALGIGHTNSINDCNTSLGEDAIHRVSTNGLSVALFS
ncbi:hypothetical protein CDG79_11840 [Nostoc sp. 'Peltigera membranacea cyanobiont' 232]|nr:hypothetical protein CDG79_11840 [Nostoc sp. 'Peltigera membranacea cyanobiont' 232]